MTAPLESNNRQFRIQPKLFILYLGMASMVMLFSAFSSALIVKRGDIKNWMDVALPSLFYVSTLVIIVSSFCIHFAKKSIGTSRFAIWSILTIIMGIAFLVMQFMSWQQMTSQGVAFRGHPSGSFIYIISAVHGIHYILGVFFLILLDRLYKKRASMADFDLYYNIIVQYWHFIGFVWVYLFILFKFFIYH